MKVNGSFPAINFKSLPSLHNARWNSRAIYALLAFILTESDNNQLRLICDFIASNWSDIWFSDMQYSEHDFQNLEQAITSTSAMKTLKTFWSHEPSRIQGIQRSNICAERAIKVMQEIHPRDIDKMNYRFILQNNF